MTVPPVSRDQVSPARRVGTDRDDPEPSLEHLLQDPILHALMKRDGVDHAQLNALILETRRKLGFSQPDAWSPAPLFEAMLFAECRAA